jgi:hypothetical protein
MPDRPAVARAESRVTATGPRVTRAPGSVIRAGPRVAFDDPPVAPFAHAKSDVENGCDGKANSQLTDDVPRHPVTVSNALITPSRHDAITRLLPPRQFGPAPPSSHD